MSLSAERIALANRAIDQTFARTSVAWRCIPHWYTGDPAQTRVPTGNFSSGDEDSLPPPNAGEPLHLTPFVREFTVTSSQASAQTADALVSASIVAAVGAARLFDAAILGELSAAAENVQNLDPDDLDTLDALARWRMYIEDSGYLSAAVAIVCDRHFKLLSAWYNGTQLTASLMQATNANALVRSPVLNADDLAVAGCSVLLGRMQSISPDRAMDASAGEEPVDLAVAVGPGLEVIGEDDSGRIHLAVRIVAALRVKDARAVVRFEGEPEDGAARIVDAAAPQQPPAQLGQLQEQLVQLQKQLGQQQELLAQQQELLVQQRQLPGQQPPRKRAQSSTKRGRGSK